MASWWWQPCKVCHQATCLDAAPGEAVPGGSAAWEQVYNLQIKFMAGSFKADCTDVIFPLAVAHIQEVVVSWYGRLLHAKFIDILLILYRYTL